MSIPFDTLEYAKNLEAAGVPCAQAQQQSQLLADLLGKVAASPSDLQSFERSLSSSIEAWETRLGANLDQFQGEPLGPKVGFDVLQRGLTHCKWMLVMLFVLNWSIFLKLFLC
jgi:hypothetical protein